MLQIPDIIVPLAGIVVGGLLLLIPTIGITVRLAAKPLVDAWREARVAPAAEERLRIMEQRLSLLEQQIESVERDNQRLLEDADFRLKLKGHQ